MASVIDPDVPTRRWRRAEYDRLVELGIFAGERLELLDGEHRDYLHGHPSTAALVVEVADSSLGLDRRLKVVLYARAGLPEYWIANLVEGVLEVHREPGPEPETAYGWVYRSVEILRPPASVTPLAAPGSLIPVADLLP
jgi:Uma2 family endonuclease